jgi:hypothetical protein
MNLLYFLTLAFMMVSCCGGEDIPAQSNQMMFNPDLTDFNENGFTDTLTYPRGLREYNSSVNIYNRFLDSTEHGPLKRSRILGSCQAMRNKDTLFVELISSGFDTEALVLTTTQDTFMVYHYMVSCIKNDALNFYIPNAHLTLNRRFENVCDTLIGSLDVSFERLHYTWEIKGNFKAIIK